MHSVTIRLVKSAAEEYIVADRRKRSERMRKPKQVVGLGGAGVGVT
jgi:hypothetical protein